MNAVSRDSIKVKGFKRLINSFKFALDGLGYAFKYEQNILVHFTVMIIVIIMGIFLKISFIEWLICLILFGLVIATELINTSIEATIDLITDKIHPLVFALTAIIVGLLIFLPKIIMLF